MLVIEAPVLILDEPTMFLDRRARTDLFSALADLRAAGTSIIIASHDRPMLDSFAGAVISIENGAIH